MTPEAWVGLVAVAVTTAVFVLGAAGVVYWKLAGLGTQIAVLATELKGLSEKLEKVIDNDLPHIREKLEDVATEWQDQRVRCVAHQVQLKAFGEDLKGMKQDVKDLTEVK